MREANRNGETRRHILLKQYRQKDLDFSMKILASLCESN